MKFQVTENIVFLFFFWKASKFILKLCFWKLCLQCGSVDRTEKKRRLMATITDTLFATWPGLISRNMSFPEAPSCFLFTVHTPLYVNE